MPQRIPQRIIDQRRLRILSVKKAGSLLPFWRSVLPKLYLGCIALQTILFCRYAGAQVFGGEYLPEEEGPSLAEKILTSPAASLLVVLIGSAGIFNYFFSSGKGERSDKQALLAIVCFLLVIFMVWYRFSLWNEKR